MIGNQVFEFKHSFAGLLVGEGSGGDYDVLPDADVG